LPVQPVKPTHPASSDGPPTQPDAPNTVLTPEGLAAADTILSYCAQVDRNAAPTYQQFLAGITQGHDSAETAAVRTMPEYANTQGSINAELAKVQLVSGLSACRTINAPTRKLGVSSPIRTRLGSAD